MSKLSLINIEKSFQKQKVLKKLNLTIESGQMVALLGPSGCGKTTTLKLLAGLLSPESGDILVDGESLCHKSAEKRQMVVVFQEPRLFPHMTVIENIAFGLKVQKKSKADQAAVGAAMLEKVQLQGLESAYPHQLSGGQKQRVALARALALQPKVLLLDEPFSSLDPELRIEMRQLLVQIQRDLQMTTLLVTHDKEEAWQLADKIALMLEGEIVQYDSPAVLYNGPKSLAVANFLGEINVIQGILDKGIFQTGLLRLSSTQPWEGRAKALIRPEHIQIKEPSKAAIEGLIRQKYFAGDRWYYQVETAYGLLKVTTLSGDQYEVNQPVSLALDAEKLILLQERGIQC